MSSLSSKQILSLITATPGRKGYGGKVAAAARHIRQRNSRGVQDNPESHDKFVRELEGIDHRVGRVKVEEYHHPERDPRADAVRTKLSGQRYGNGGKQQSYEFTATDLAWLNRLPSDPAAVSYDDAVQLASLAAASSSFADPSGHRLVQSIWKPVKEVHDAKAAASALQQSRQQVHDEPGSAVDALADALAAEEQFGPDEDARSRARRMIDDAFDQLEDGRLATIEDAKAAAQTAEDARSKRTSISRV